MTALRRFRPALLPLCLLASPFASGPLWAQTVQVGHAGSAAAAIDLATLPAAEATLTFGNPPVPHRFAGPLIWTILTAAHAADPARHADAVRQVLRIQGADGYVALVAVGEVAPEFGDKPALLATTMDGKPLPHPRAVIPGDKRPGRSVRDVVSLELEGTH